MYKELVGNVENVYSVMNDFHDSIKIINIHKVKIVQVYVAAMTM